MMLCEKKDTSLPGAIIIIIFLKLVYRIRQLAVGERFVARGCILPKFICVDTNVNHR